VKRLLVIAIAAGALQACAGAIVVAPQKPDTPGPVAIVLQDIGTISLVIDPDRGGAIVSANAIDGDSRSPEMVDNTSPTGRQWQAAFWDGPCSLLSDQALCTGAPNCLNPTAAGDACGRRSGGTVLERTPSSITIESRPLDFSASPARPLLVRTRITIAGLGLLRLDYHVTNESAQSFGADAWQTLPVLFTPPEYSSVTSYLPDGSFVYPDRDRASVTDDQWRSWSPDWVARSTSDGWTVLVYVPGRHPWSVGFPGEQSPGAGWMQPLQWLELAPGESGDATAWIAVGRSLGQVRQRIGSIQ
jgi:hypothetical protein